MRWTKLTGLEVDFDSDITSSTVSYPLPLVKSSQKGGQINGVVENLGTDTQDDTLVKGGQKKVVRTSGQNQGDETRSKIVEAMRKKPEISRRELAETVGISQSALPETHRTPERCWNHYPSWQRQEGTVEGVEIIWHIHVISCNNRVFRNLGTALQSEF